MGKKKLIIVGMLVILAAAVFFLSSSEGSSPAAAHTTPGQAGLGAPIDPPGLGAPIDPPGLGAPIDPPTESPPQNATAQQPTQEFPDEWITFKQPSEQKGESKYRSYRIKAHELENRPGSCISVDDMDCGEGERCLKWGWHSYAGRVNIPSNRYMIVGYSNYSCGDDKIFAAAHPVDPGEVPRDIDFWDYHNRASSFKIRRINKDGIMVSADYIDSLLGKRGRYT